MTKRNLIILTSVSVLLICWSACNKKEQAVAPPLPGNEPLTTLTLRVVNANDATDTSTASWVQLDPTGTTNPDTSHATLHLKSGASYNVTVQLLDSLNDITSEIKDRENYHLFCFDVASGLNLTCKQTDLDTNPKPLPIGLADLFTTGAASTGSLEVTLHHQPNVKDGTCAPGSIDIDATFTIQIK
jgi:hypothetical protein